MELPAAFEEKMRALLQEEFDDYIACYKEPRYYGMRVNTGKISVEEFEKICPFEIKKIPWIENGFYYDGDLCLCMLLLHAPVLLRKNGNLSE